MQKPFGFWGVPLPRLTEEGLGKALPASKPYQRDITDLMSETVAMKSLRCITMEVSSLFLV